MRQPKGRVVLSIGIDAITFSREDIHEKISEKSWKKTVD